MGDDSSKPIDPGSGSGATHAPAIDLVPAPATDVSKTSGPVGEAIDKTRIHAVAAGDTLAGLAAHYYGDAEAWPRIFAANRDQLTDPQRIAPGQMLKIPVDC